MRTQCERIYSALPTQCERICNGACGTVCVSDASPESIDQNPKKGVGLSGSIAVGSPSPSVHREVWQILVGGLHSLSENDHGHPWPYPVRGTLRRLLAAYDSDLCIQAAREAREIVQSQDRAPNITGLFEKKLRDLAEVRGAVRGALSDVAIVGEGEPCL